MLSTDWELYQPSLDYYNTNPLYTASPRPRTPAPKQQLESQAFEKSTTKPYVPESFLTCPLHDYMASITHYPSIHY